MPSIRAQGNRFEIRECRSTGNGPRQATLARFSGVLTPDVLDAAASRAQRPFDRSLVLERARRAGIPISPVRHNATARQLLAALRMGTELDPVLTGLLVEALAIQPATATPDHLAEATEWIGRSEAERGRALRGLTRTASRISKGRERIRATHEAPFPRFESTGTRDDSRLHDLSSNRESA